MRTSSERKSAQLGIPFGTAMHRLRKSITFHLLQKLGEDICYVCSKPIETVDELSYEHKIPWEGDDTNELFWNVDNIAFSHLQCNKPHHHPGTPLLRKTGPEGYEWCIGCQAFLEREKFHAHPSRWNGLRKLCIWCKREESRKYRKKKKADKPG